MSQDRLTPLDASFLHMEEARQPMHVGSVMIFDGEAPTHAELIDHVESRLTLVPRYRQKLATVPFGQGRPKWVDDDEFDLAYHIRATALPRPGSEDELKNLAGRVFAGTLDRAKPLWEMWLVDGLEGGRFAMLTKTHHAMVDGISGLDILSVLFADEGDADRGAARDWRPETPPSGVSMLTEALWQRTTQPAEFVRPVWALMRRPRQVAEKVVQFVVGTGAFAWAGLQPAPRTPYNDGLVGENRRFTWMRGNLDDVKTIKNSLGGTVNDVILTLVTRALRNHMVARGESVDGLTMKAFVPVSMRSDDERGGDQLGNKVGGIIAPLPVGCSNPKSCLDQISEAMGGLKKSGQPVGAQALTELSGFAPPNLVDQAVRLPIPQRFVNLVVTNVPGPQFPLNVAGRELLDIIPQVPLANNMNLGIAIVSYNGSIDIGLVGDYDKLHDLDDLAEHFYTALGELAEAAGVELKGPETGPSKQARPAREPAVTNGNGNGSGTRSAPRPFARYEPAPEYREPAGETIVAERPVLPEEPLETEDELVAQSGESGAETAPGPEIAIAEPWDGYAKLKTGEIRDRLQAATPEVAGMVEIYERANRSRRGVIEAAERAQRAAENES